MYYKRAADCPQSCGWPLSADAFEDKMFCLCSTLIMHGDHDQIALIADSAILSAKITKSARS